MKNLKIYNIKDNEKYKLSREYPKVVTLGCAYGLLAGLCDLCENYDYISSGNQLPIKNLFINLTIFVGTGAIVFGLGYPIFYPLIKTLIKKLNESTKDDQQNENNKPMVLKKTR